MSPFELKQLRHTIGASLSRMAQLLGLSGKNAADTVRKYENGNAEMTQPLQRLATYLQQGTSIGQDMDNVLPEYLFGTDIREKITLEWLFRTRYPRFLACITDTPIEGTLSSTADNVEYINVSMWIDEPVEGGQIYVDEAAKLWTEYSERAAKDGSSQ